MKLFFDTETTGKADFNSPSDALHQPRIVQLAALLTNDDGAEVSTLNVIIKPDGFEIPVEASNIHGITTEKAKLCGVESIPALQVFAGLCAAADTVIAHNIQFDALMMDIEGYRNNFEDDLLGSAPQFCTMKALTPVCKLPSPYGGYKWPKLQEAHVFAFGKEFESAHDAMADVRACAAMYFWLQKQGGGQ